MLSYIFIPISLELTKNLTLKVLCNCPSSKNWFSTSFNKMSKSERFLFINSRKTRLWLTPVLPNFVRLTNVCQAWSGILDCNLKYNKVQSGTGSDWRNWAALSPIIASMTCRGLLDLLATLLAISLKMRPTSEMWTWSARTSARWTWNLSQTSFIEVYTSFATLSSFFTSSLSTIFGFTFASGANNSTLLSYSARDFNLTWARSRSALSWSFSFRMIAMRSVAALSSSTGSIALDVAWTSSVSESICIELWALTIQAYFPISP